MAYTFSTELLSAQKTGSPNLIGTSLSAVGATFLSGANVTFATQQVVVLSLSTTDVGIAFNPISITVASNNLSTFNINSYPLSTVNVLGSRFVIPTALNNSTFALVENISKTYTVFTWLSTTASVSLTATTSTQDVLTPNRLRLRMLGYA
jgi:hypothetical protein